MELGRGQSVAAPDALLACAKTDVTGVSSARHHARQPALQRRVHGHLRRRSAGAAASEDAARRHARRGTPTRRPQVVWEVAIVRDAPKTGKVLARLQRGATVHLGHCQGRLVPGQVRRRLRQRRLAVSRRRRALSAPVKKALPRPGRRPRRRRSSRTASCERAPRRRPRGAARRASRRRRGAAARRARASRPPRRGAATPRAAGRRARALATISVSRLMATSNDGPSAGGAGSEAGAGVGRAAGHASGRVVRGQAGRKAQGRVARREAPGRARSRPRRRRSGRARPSGPTTAPVMSAGAPPRRPARGAARRPLATAGAAGSAAPASSARRGQRRA